MKVDSWPKSVKLLLGVVSLWPIIYMFVFMAFFFSAFFSMPLEDQGGIPASFGILFCLHGLTMILMLSLIATYGVHVFNTERIDKDKKILWAIFIVFFGIVTFPVYWYLHVWKEQNR